MPLMVARLQSPYSADEVRRQLESIVRPSTDEFTWPWPMTRAAAAEASRVTPFEGSVSADGFKIRRIIGYRNPFWPVVRGSIRQDRDGAHLKLAVSLHPATAVFTFVLLGVLLLAAVLPGGEKDTSGNWPLVFPVLLIAVFIVPSFVGQAREAVRLIRECVGGAGR